MKSMIIVLTLLIGFSGNSQTQFSFNADGTSDWVVYQADNMKATDIYKKIYAWINETYKNPELVIKAKVENEMIRLEGFDDAAFGRTMKSGNKADYSVNYTLEVQVQDGKFRVKYTHDKISVDGSEVYFSITDVLSNIPDKNGNAWNGSKAQYEDSVRVMLDSLNKYIIQPKDSW